MMELEQLELRASPAAMDPAAAFMQQMPVVVATLQQDFTLFQAVSGVADQALANVYQLGLNMNAFTPAQALGLGSQLSTIQRTALEIQALDQVFVEWTSLPPGQMMQLAPLVQSFSDSLAAGLHS